MEHGFSQPPPPRHYHIPLHEIDEHSDHGFSDGWEAVRGRLGESARPEVFCAHSRDVRDLGRVRKTQAQASSCLRAARVPQPSGTRDQNRVQAVLGTEWTFLPCARQPEKPRRSIVRNSGIRM